MKTWKDNLKAIDIAETMGEQGIDACKIIYLKNYAMSDIWHVIAKKASADLSKVSRSPVLALVILSTSLPHIKTKMSRANDGDVYAEMTAQITFNLRGFLADGSRVDCHAEFTFATDRAEEAIIQMATEGIQGMQYPVDEIEWRVYGEIALMLLQVDDTHVYMDALPKEFKWLTARDTVTLKQYTTDKFTETRDRLGSALALHALHQEYWNTPVTFLTTSEHREALYGYLKLNDLLIALQTMDTCVSAVRVQDSTHFGKVFERSYSPVAGASVFEGLMRELVATEPKSRVTTVKLPTTGVPCALFVRPKMQGVQQLLLITPYVVINVMLVEDTKKASLTNVIYNVAIHSVQEIADKFKHTNPTFVKLVKLNDLRTVQV